MKSINKCHFYNCQIGAKNNLYIPGMLFTFEGRCQFALSKNMYFLYDLLNTKVLMYIKVYNIITLRVRILLLYIFWWNDFFYIIMCTLGRDSLNSELWYKYHLSVILKQYIIAIKLRIFECLEGKQSET